MSSLLNPNHVASFDPGTGRVVITFRDGRDVAVVELDATGAPALINALMAATHQAKTSTRATTPPPPPVRIGPRPSLAVRSVLGMHGPKGGGRARRS